LTEEFQLRHEQDEPLQIENAIQVQHIIGIQEIEESLKGNFLKELLKQLQASREKKKVYYSQLPSQNGSPPRKATFGSSMQ